MNKIEEQSNAVPTSPTHYIVLNLLLFLFRSRIKKLKTSFVIISLLYKYSRFLFLSLSCVFSLYPFDVLRNPAFDMHSKVGFFQARWCYKVASIILVSYQSKTSCPSQSLRKHKYNRYYKSHNGYYRSVFYYKIYTGAFSP